MAYSELVWSHFARPRNAGAWPASRCDVGTGSAATPASDAVMRIQVRVSGGRVVEARFQAYGCVSTIAAGSWLSERVTGVDLADARALRAAEIADALDLAPVKRHCALLAEDALCAALTRFTDGAAGAENRLSV